MGVLGKFLGGTLGFAIGGPLGAIAGAAFGHVFDKSGDPDIIGGRPRLSYGESTQLTFYVATFSMLAKMVQADGEVKQEELDAVEQFMTRDLNLDPHGRNVTRNIFHAAMRSNQRFEDFAYQFFAEFKNKPQFLELMIDILVRVSTADGSMNTNEEKLIVSALNIFQLENEHFKTVREKYIGVSDKSYAILGCDVKDSNDRIKSRYRKLVSDFHPDMIASKGLPEEFTRFASEKFQEIQAAYEEIKKERGIK
jgi:DnaJ like chaperone protein